MMDSEIDAALEIRRDTSCEIRHIRRNGRQRDNELAVAVSSHIGVVETAFALGGTTLAKRQQPGQPSIGGTILRIGEEAGAVGEVEAATDDEADSDLLCRVMRADNAGKAVAVGDRNCLVSKCGGGQHQLVRMRG